MELDIISIITQVAPNRNCVIIAINNTIRCILQHSLEVSREDAALMGMDNMIIEVVVEDWDRIAHDVHSNL